jgi:hypothetical protein
MSSRLRFSVANAEQAIWIRAEGGALPLPVHVRLGTSADGRLIATGVQIETDGELNARDLRLPLARIVSEFGAAASHPRNFKRFMQEAYGMDVVWEGGEPSKMETALGELLRWSPTSTRRSPVPRSRPGRRGYPAEHYRQVAKVYRQAKRQRPRAPIRFVMDELHASEPTVHRWLNAAVEKGLLREEER